MKNLFGGKIFEYIYNKIYKIYNDFIEEIDSYESLRELRDLRYNDIHLHDYRKKVVQQLYLLRYLPYLIEYYQKYRDLFDTNHLNLSLDIMSIGSGNDLDFHEAAFAFSSKDDFYYIGIDKIEWYYKENNEHFNYRFFMQNINKWTKLDKDT
ncbi:hypothetical protein [Vulcanibacillus modesticaldus]|nr:hypothetical protein [Vulcanibacillus modesticaldus]